MIHGDPATNRYNPAGPDANVAASVRRLAGWMAEWKSRGLGYWIAHDRDEHRLVGFGGLTFATWRDREVLNLYYRLAPAMWGKGYATELGKHAVALASNHSPTVPIVARTRPENTSAAACAVRCGLARRPDLDTEHHAFAKNWGTWTFGG